jgi:5'(3')-deoxyribonucleotidase|tara:strand:- start:15144 stop:15650 length:507 start_codon:yes stop_codon:yes gene_type:complete
MKHLVELQGISEQELPTIYLDMDQVLCNFLKGADKAVGGSFVKHPSPERWQILNQTKNFWANLEWMPGGKQLYRFASRYDPHILSAYAGKDKNSRVGKMKWLTKNTKVPRGKIHLVVRSQKKSFAKGNNVLVDDYIKNIEEWKSNGGIGILHENTNKTIQELKKLGFK